MVKVTVTKNTWELIDGHVEHDEMTSIATANAIHIANGAAYVTDGKRALRFKDYKEYMHTKDEFIAIGTYKIYGKPVKSTLKGFWDIMLEAAPDLQAPDYSRVWIDEGVEVITSITVEKRNALRNTAAVLNIFEKTCRAINYDYIEALATSPSATYSVHTAAGKETDAFSPLLFKDGDNIDIIVLPFDRKA